MEIDLKQIRELLAVVSQTDITELTIESGDQKITVRKSQSTTVHMVPSDAVLPTPMVVAQSRMPANATMSFEPRTVEPVKSTAPEPSNDNDRPNESFIPITSPMVGTFYRSPSPSAPPFVSIGDSVTVGQTVCIIEAMKLMNDMPSEVAGRIVKICVDNGTTVEYGQPLFLVDPKG